MKKIAVSIQLFLASFIAFSQEAKKFNDTTSLRNIELSAVRVNEKAPFSKTNLTKKELQLNNTGQDLPFILNLTPSMVVNSDAGNGIGYTAMRIRGTDATRINVTLNGIPYNDAESQATFLVDLPDFVSSVNSIQIQRGVGTSSNGTGAFGATISLSSNETNEKAYAEINNSFGSFNSWKNTVKVGSGLINNHLTIDARLSSITSDGYIDRASSNLKAFYLSGAWIGKQSSLRLNVFSGKEKTYQAWNGVPDYLLDTLRTYNSAGNEKPGNPYNNETDNYTQTHYQLFFNQQVNSKMSFNTAVFLTRGLGYYENYKGQEAFSQYGLPDLILADTTITNTDLVRQKWLNNYFYGQILSIRFKQQHHLITFGGGWNSYDGKHYGDITWAQYGIDKDYRYYYLTSKKTDQNVYLKWEFNITPYLNLFTDIQYRHVGYKMHGFDDNPSLFINRNFDFIDPKLGLSYIKNGWKSYISYAMANKEPARADFEASVITQPKKETLHDFEAGIEKKNNKLSVAATLYFMAYKDQLVLTGQVNDVGAYTRTNVPNSYRAGIELEAGYVFNKWLHIQGNLSFSKNKIKAFSEYLDEYDANGDWVGQKAIAHNNKDIAFSPSVTGAASIDITPLKNLECSLIGKYVGRQYLDNTQSNNRQLKAYYTQDARIVYYIKNKLFSEWNISVRANNIFSKKYEPNGYVYPYIYDNSLYADKYYYPMAPINWSISLNISL